MQSTPGGLRAIALCDRFAAIAAFGSRMRPTTEQQSAVLRSADSRQRSVSRSSSFLLERNNAVAIIDSKEAQVRDLW
jgi:hypothetical protein